MQLYVGASGDDKYGVAFSSGWMIQEINRFSVLSLYDNSKMDVSGLLLHATAFVLPYIKHIRLSFHGCTLAHTIQLYPG